VRLPVPALRLGAVVLALSSVLVGCSGSGDDPDALVVYNAQHKSLTELWAKGFTKQTGIKVVLRQGGDFDLANQLEAEGAKSKADVFLTENSPAMAVVEKAGLFADVDQATRAQVPQRYSTTSGKWVGIAARSTVFVYNPSKLAAKDLPRSIMDLADPTWSGRWGAGAGGADFKAIVSAILALKGEPATRAWLTAMKKNAKIYSNNISTMTAVNNGEVDGGVIYHYYWYRNQAGSKDISKNTQLHYFGQVTPNDPGAFVSVSGGGVLKAGKHQQQAQQFLAYITGKQGQQALADSNALEYPVGSGVAAAPALVPLPQLRSPLVDPSTLNGPEVIRLMTQAGLL
jgi:iron(III) transport system substrate-binding protein